MQIPNFYFIIPLMLTFSSNTVLADDAGCRNLGEIAQTIMKHRQSGTPISSVIETVNKVFSNPDAVKIMKAIVVEAYETPLYSSESIKEESSEIRSKSFA